MTSIVEALEANDLTPACLPKEIVELKHVKPAREEDVELVHATEHITKMRQKANDEAPCIVADFEEPPDNVTYMTKTSYEDSLKGIGVALALVDCVAAADRAGTTPKGFGLIRPPGHHATTKAPMGFCLFNNVAIAARHAQKCCGLNKVLIVDFDVHHGNGTQDIFYKDPSVLFIDMHQLDVWPGSGQVSETGKGEGKGSTINVPLPIASGDEVAGQGFERIIAPAARRFAPDIILVSAGFDAHWRDPLEQLNFQSATYHKLVSGLRDLADELCGGRLVVLLEGGYSMQGLSEGVCEAFQALLGRPPLHPHDPQVPPEPLHAAKVALDDIVALHGLAS
ncbi:g11131 [Coccomyxa elongata]